MKFGPNIGDIDGSDALGFLVPPNLVRLGQGPFAALSWRPTSAEVTRRRSHMWACRLH